MRPCRFPFLHTGFVLLLDFSMTFFRRNAILGLQFLFLIPSPSCLNNQNQMKHLQKHMQLIAILQMSHPPNH